MRKLFTKLLAVFAVAVSSAMTAVAAEPFPTNGSPITSGVVYSVKAWTDYNATFTPSVSGKLVQDGCPELELNGASKEFLGYGDNGQKYAWEVIGGKSYTISNFNAIFSDGTVSFTMEAEMGLQCLRTVPGSGSEVSPIVNFSGDILFYFNTAVIFDQAYIVAGSQRIEVPNTSFQTSTISLNVREAMNLLYVTGTLSREGGDPLSVEIEGLQTTSGVLYNGTGRLAVNYVSSPQLTDLVSTNIPKVLKSYYPAGDREGIWTFVFDRNIMDDGQTTLTISCGNPESDGSYYNEVLRPKIDGATITFDLTDKLRELDDYLMYQGSNYVAVKLGNVRDTDGNMALGSGGGNVASYSYSLSYNYLKQENVVCEFLPASGTSLQGVNEVEIWYNNASMIEFDGVEFTYNTESGMQTAVVLKSQLQTTLENNEMTILCPIPEVVQGHDQITVRLYNMRSVDGYNYRIEAQYDMFVVSLLSPIKPGQTIASTGTEDFVFSINLTSQYFYFRYDFYNAEGPEGFVYGTELHQQGNGTWTAYNGDFPCYSNFDPYIVVSAYYFEDDYYHGGAPVETYTFKFKGTTKPFEFSPVKFVSISPDMWDPIVPEEDFCFTVTYDGLVNIDTKASGIMLGMGAGVEPFAQAEPIYGSDEYVEGYAPVWRLYPPSWILESNDFIDISIFAKDENGLVVEGNLGAGEMDCMQFSYMVYKPSNFLPLTVTPENYSVVDTLNTFTFSYPGKDVGVNYSYTDDVNIRILKDWWENVAEYAADDLKIEVNEDGNTVLVLKIDPITEPGMYVLMVPENYLLIGDQFDVHGNEVFFGEYTVTATDGIEIIPTEKASQEIYNLQGIRVSGKLIPGLYIVDGKKVYIK